jgi:hypothetical protein
MKKKREKVLTGRAVDAMSDAEKAKLIADIDAQTPEQRLAESKPLTSAQRARWNKFKKKMGRPKIGAGTQLISMTIEKGLLKRADAYAKRHGLKRTQLIAQGLRAVMGESDPRSAA